MTTFERVDVSQVVRVSALIMCVVATITTTGACSAADPALPSAETSPAPITTSSSPADFAREQATEAYLGMWRNYAKAATTSDWLSPLLSEFATGEALDTMRQGLQSDHSQGLVAKGAPKNNPSVSSVDPVTDPVKVMIDDCGDSSNWLRYRADTGEVVDDEPEGRRSITATVEKQQDGAWRVSGFAVQGVGTC